MRAHGLRERAVTSAESTRSEAAELAAAAEDVADAYRVKAETLRVGDTTTATAADLEAPRVWFEVAAERLVDVCG